MGVHCSPRGARRTLRNTTMQRCYRDIHSATQHILLADQIVEEAGRALLGLTAPNAQWTYLESPDEGGKMDYH